MFSFQLFLNCLCNLQHNLILCEIDTEKLFCNIPEIYFANRSFWHHHIFPMLQVSCQPVGSTISVFLLTCKCKHREKSKGKNCFLKVFLTQEKCTLYRAANVEWIQPAGGFKSSQGEIYNNAQPCVTKNPGSRDSLWSTALPASSVYYRCNVEFMIICDSICVSFHDLFHHNNPTYRRRDNHDNHSTPR